MSSSLRTSGTARTRAARRFPVLALGASAGGLEALSQFLRALPAAAGRNLALLVVQHMEPERASLLQDLLQRDSALPVVPITDGLALQAGRVYIAPPTQHVTVRDGCLYCVDGEAGRSARQPIDFLFTSLAGHELTRAVAVVLSGSGADGSAGVRAVHERGGLVAVQNPDTAAFASMPEQALETGVADLVADAAELPALILRALQRAPRTPPRDLALADPDGSLLRRIVQQLLRQTGHDFSHYKRNTLYRRIERRVHACRLHDAQDYADYLQHNAREASLLLKELLIGVTRFFRDGDVWDYLRCDAIPALLRRYPQGQLLRAWVPGCASGEEAYSLAICFNEAVAALGSDAPYALQIFATDLDQQAIAVARKGVYPASIAADIPPDWLQRWFVAEGGQYRVSKPLRDMLIFAPHNVLTDPPFSRIDVLTCRNLLIYLTPDVHEDVLARFHYSMNADALLVLGSSESIGSATHLFRSLTPHLQLYQRLNTPLHERRLNLGAGLSTVQLNALQQANTMPLNSNPAHDLQALADQFLLRHYAPVAIVTTHTGDILHVSGRTDAYLELPQGKVQLNILALARPALRPVLTEAFHDALRLGVAVTLQCEPDAGAAESDEVTEVTVHPLEEPQLGQGMMVVLRQRALQTPLPADPEGRFARQSARLRLLETELQQARDEIQTTREEMQTSREELTSTNEELQSTNEELTTSAEELRTMNEELVRARAAAENTLARYTDLFDSAPVGYFALERNGTIVQANREAAALLGMERERVPGGRLVMYVCEADRPRFLACLERIWTRGEAQICEVGLWREAEPPRPVRISMLMASDGSACRLAVSDISEAKLAEAAMRASEERFRTLWETATDVVLVLDAGNIVRYVNPAVQQVFGYSPPEVIGQNLAMLQPEHLRDSHRQALEDYMQTGQRQLDWTLTRAIGQHRDGHQFPVEISFSQFNIDGEVQFAGFMRDITSRTLAEVREATHARVMTLLAAAAALPEVLEAIVRGVEAERPGALCSVLLLNDAGTHLLTAAAPNLPSSYNKAIDGAPIGPTAGSCGTAAYFGRRVIVEDIARDPLWAKYRQVAARAGLGACWSEPIRSSAGRVLGTFAIYHRERHAPAQVDIDTIVGAARLAALAIERHQAEEQLRRMRQLLEASQSLAHIGGFEIDLETDAMLWSAEMYRLHEVSPDEFAPTVPAAMHFLTPRSQALVTAARERIFREGVVPDLQLELVTARGRHLHVEMRGTFIPVDGKLGKVIGTVQDVTERRQAAAALRASEERLRLALKATHQGLFDLDVPSGRMTVNAEYAGMLGYEHGEFQETLDSWLARLHPEDRARVLKAWTDYLGGSSDEFRVEARQRTRRGDWIWVLSVAALVERDADQHPQRLIGIHVDVTERRQAEDKLQLAALVYQHSSEAMMVCAADNTVIAINPAFTQLTGYSAEEVLGRDPRFLASGRHDSAFFAAMWQQLQDKGHWQGEVWNRRKNGELFAESLSINTIRDASGQISRYVALFSDITEQKASEALIWQQANFDALTQLPNRRMFRDRLQHDIQKCQRERLPLALLFIDLDRFKEVNDTLGHEQGDVLLAEAARRIRSYVRQSDTVARLGGDEFTVILTELSEPGRVDFIAQNILEALSTPFVLDNNEQAYVSASIGITLFPNDATDIDELLRNADQALYAAKDAGRNRFSYFTPQMQQAAVERMRLTQDLRRALEQQQFELYFQPVIDLSTGRISKAEALVRWQHPERGLINPLHFIGLAESSGLILDLGEWVFEQALHWMRQWQARGLGLQVSINQSPVEFQRDARRYQGWVRRLQEEGLNGQTLLIEITESLLLDASPHIADTLLLLRDAGVQVALDDFGTGYSSLSWLKKFDIDYLKIDPSFVQGLPDDASDRALVQATVAMAHTLGLKVIAEGVEAPAQLDALRQMGCDCAQGFVFTEPLAGSAFDALLTRQQPV